MVRAPRLSAGHIAPSESQVMAPCPILEEGFKEFTSPPEPHPRYSAFHQRGSPDAEAEMEKVKPQRIRLHSASHTTSCAKARMVKFPFAIATSLYQPLTALVPFIQFYPDFTENERGTDGYGGLFAAMTMKKTEMKRKAMKPDKKAPKTTKEMAMMKETAITCNQKPKQSFVCVVGAYHRDIPIGSAFYGLEVGSLG
ncbi:hypothetical protein EW146_g2610 [Bondarzewia mesenterica]|uniref:Uncharacterized protein n=1 Tax=Bondarzewia mesenterica TaxID=1095465 RepID=A0A4S4M0C9_9AGAM|nr:hypothetical protein EW146_g2610 [Bondarzewia mesenterica]